MDGVNVRCDGAGVDQGIQPGKTDATTARHAPKGRGALDGS